ncbi:hypothetical protein SERLADRAFT_453395 [Serpula lacrymans var. lacrymans S7.9]|uniref:Vps72/YL1 C-terminal domain-containing protein n=1 Tax=Serpula lacrymans var. lacrymans (strain S7.9) TaxID=578457 RepID=F8PAY1_SERL9|nr:uncharacterized protein SERLADRAFT_453395 [Serpula lacrymans var. lacrymans S7.9]EGO19422.1 hypothetical protein SERLADRAFT_453395 [Serpula lacrymans var. lacrymans S7.9]
MAEPDEPLVTRRSKRSTAGNRMEAALAELALEDPKDTEDDVDFVVGKDEEDIFESDFASTDEEAIQEGLDPGEATVQDEERKERKAARARVDKATAAAHARQRVTFNPQAHSSSSNDASRPKLRPKRRVSLGVAINVETGEVIEGSKRQSQRRHTIMSTSATVSRIKDAEEKKASVPKRLKVRTRAPTQDELIALALDTEEGNIIEHRDYLKLEEEKRARARVIRPHIEGPMLRWVSRAEEIKMIHSPLVTQPNGGSIVTSNISVYSSFRAFPTDVSVAAANPTQPLFASADVGNPNTPSACVPASEVLVSSPQVSLSVPGGPGSLSTQAERKERICKNYVIHARSQSEITSKPIWRDTMSAMFGDHVKWEDLRVYSGKQRPLTRPRTTCLLSGLPAQYLDPRTNVPFANVRAYRTLTQILGHHYSWSGPLGCYVSLASRDGQTTDEGRLGKRRRSETEERDSIER